jgi:ferritin-like metal-binding protein YciE
MALFSETIRDLKTLYIHELRSMLSSERQIYEALPNMEEAATDPQLKAALHTHREETLLQADRLQQILTEVAGDTDDKKCAVTAELISSGKSLIKDAVEGPIRDEAIIASAQRVEHFEMTSYGTLRSWASSLRLSAHAAMLDITLKEEGNADHVLTPIAERLNTELAITRAAAA